jgi:hypothetical protein
VVGLARNSVAPFHSVASLKPLARYARQNLFRAPDKQLAAQVRLAALSINPQ